MTARLQPCTWCAVVAMMLAGAVQLPAQAPCARLDAPWWQLGAIRFFQSSGEGQQVNALGTEQHVVDRRVLRRDGAGFRLDIARIRLGLRDTTVAITVTFGANGGVTNISGDIASLAYDVAPLLMRRCADLKTGNSFADLGGHSDTVTNALQRSVTRAVPSRETTIGEPIDTLGARLLVVSSQRSATDTSRGQLLRRLPNQQVDTVRPWTLLAGEETERLLVRPSDGVVVFRERVRRLSGRGWVPPHDLKDTVPIRVESANVERVVDSATAALIIGFARRGEQLVSGTLRDSVAMHYREWRGDTLVVRQVRRSGWRDEFRTVWRDGALVSASLMEPGTATQPHGPFYRTFRVAGAHLFDSGARDSSVATPTNPWAIALDGFEDALIPALNVIPADSQPHRFSAYAWQNDRGGWLTWSVTIVPRGLLRVAQIVSLQQQWIGVFIFTSSGELVLSNLGGAGGVTRIPAAGSRLAALLDAQKVNLKREDLEPPKAAATAVPPRVP